MKTLKSLALLGVVLLLSGCCSCRKSAGIPTTSLAQTHWTLIQQDGRLVDAGDGFYIVLEAEGGALSGKGSCNRLTGSYMLPAPGKIHLEKIASTRMLCHDQALETRFIRMLEAVDRYEIDGKLLMLFTEEELIAIFEKKE